MIQRAASDESNVGAGAVQTDPFAGSPRSLVRVLSIFEHLVKVEKGMTLTELSLALKSPKSSLLALLRPLVGSRYLVHASGRYELGPAMLQLSMNIVAGHSYASLARVFLEELAERSNESVYLTLIDREHRIVTYVDAIESKQAVRYAVGAGAVRPLFVSAAGRVLLAFQEPQWIEAFLTGGPFKSPVNGKVVGLGQLRKDLQEIRQQGCAVSLSQAIDGAAGVAAPIVDPTDRPTYALLVAAPLERMLKSLPQMQALVVEVAGRASEALSRAGSYRSARTV